MKNIIIPFFSPISDKSNNEKFLTIIKSGGWKIVEPEEYTNLSEENRKEFNIWIFIGSGGTENSVIKFLRKIRFQITPHLVSHNLNNSLPAAMEIRRYLEENGNHTKIIHEKIENLMNTLAQEIRFTTVNEKLLSYRLGLIGNQSEWLVASNIDKEAVKQIWGLYIVQIPISRLMTKFSDEIGTEISTHGKMFVQNAQNVNRSSKQLIEAQVVANAIKKIQIEYKLDAFSIECFSIIQETESTACFALSYFNDVGLVAGCEGDLPSTFSMILINLLVSQPSFMANVTHVDTDNNTVILSHCTVPLKMTENYEVFSHYESNKGVAIRGIFEVGKTVTLFKIAGKSLSEWYISTGTIIKNHIHEECCRSQVEIRCVDSVNYFLKESLANHHIMVLGDHKSQIETFLQNKLTKKERG